MTDLFANVNDGDYVRVEFKDGAIEGTVQRRFGSRRVITSWYPALCADISEYATKVTVLRRALPPEPPKDSVVLDRYDRAFQRGSLGTWFSTKVTGGYIWPKLHAELSPLRVIYTPEDK